MTFDPKYIAFQLYIPKFCALSEFCFSSRRGFFSVLCNHFLICFHRSPPWCLLQTKPFAVIEDSLGFSAQCHLLETFFGKNLRNSIFFHKYLFFERASIGLNQFPSFEGNLSLFLSPVRLLRTFSIFVQKTYGCFVTMRHFKKQSFSGNIVVLHFMQNFWLEQIVLRIQ